MSTDIIVIGGGIAGISAAARLSEHAHVTLIEAERQLGYHASGRSAALIEVNYGAASVQALNRASIAHLEEGGYLSPRGLMIVASQNEKAAFDSDLAAMGVVQITVQEALDFVPVLDPDTLAYAGYHADAHDIDTDRLMQDFARQLRGNGGTVLTGQRVQAIRRMNDKWQIETASQTLEAKTLVNAAGAWADTIADLAGIAPLGIVPHRRSMARIAAPGGQDPARWPMFFGVGETWYAKPDAGALLVSPADEDPVEPHDAWPDDMVLAEGLDRYQTMVAT
ncbi:NAD(P)/FAD-dependent oxidoreductase, partial [Sulfitobacter sp.]|uniref:NAD(P)/FAD-dependent oxidoreductase n=1 Tax=Sulfitobacter sp. TaxID=1903071 RepID=UPI004058EBD2